MEESIKYSSRNYSQSGAQRSKLRMPLSSDTPGVKVS